MKNNSKKQEIKKQPEVKKDIGINKNAIQISHFQRIENWTTSKSNLVWGILLFISVLCSLLLFDLKISIGGDDSAYIERAYDFIETGRFPFYQGPGYPIMLAAIYKIFGMKVAIFKVFSFIFYTLHVLFIWLAFRNKIPYFILIFIMGFITMNSFMQYYASQTWSEAFYFMLQSIFLYLCVKLISRSENSNKEGIIETVKKHGYLLFLVGCFYVFASQTKTIAVFIIIPVVVYFLTQKQFKMAGLSLAAMLIIKFAYEGIIYALYGPNTSPQFEQMMLIDAYKPHLGKMTIAGMFERFFENLNTYASMQFNRLLHFVPFTFYKPNKLETFLVVALLGISSFKIFKNNKYGWFLVLFSIILSCGVFFGIHANNRQDRLILITFPFLIGIIIYGIYLLFDKLKELQIVVTIIATLLLLISLYNTLGKAPESITILKKNMGKDKYAGYTTDQKNYFNMSEWCATNLPEGSIVAVRKSSMSFIATGKKMFYGINKVENADADYWVKTLKDGKVSHIMLPSLRVNPNKKTNMIIMTMYRVAMYINLKYPEMLELVHREGADEVADLYKINYDRTKANPNYKIPDITNPQPAAK